MDFDSLSQSSFISVSSYQGELEDCHLVNSGNNLQHYEVSSTTLKDDSGCEIHGDSCDDLSQQSQSSLDNSKNEMKIHYHDKIEYLLKSNRQLECELQTANDQIQRLLGCYRGATEKTSQIDWLEKKQHDLTLQNSTLQMHLSQIEMNKNDAENKIKLLQIENNNFGIEVSTKNAVITELKQKVSHQFAEIQNVSQISKEKSLLLSQINCRLQQEKNSHAWFKIQLKNCQQDKKSLLIELANLKAVLMSQNEKFSSLIIDKEDSKIQHETLQLETADSRNRQNMCEMCIDSVHVEHVKINNEDTGKLRNIEDDDKTYLKWYEENLEELRNEILNLKTLLLLKDDLFQKITAENSNAVSKCITLQKSLQETSQAVDILKHEKCNLKMQMEIISNQEKISAENYEKAKDEVVTLKSVLLASQKEKEEIDSTVHVIRSQLSVLKFKYDTMNKNIADKNKQILGLQQEIQKLYMEKNWQICELDKINEKDKIISELKKVICAQKEDIKKYTDNIECLETKLLEITSEYSDLNEEKTKLSNENLQQIQRYEMVLQQYKDLFLNSENELNDSKKRDRSSEKTISNLNFSIDGLTTELDQKNSMITGLKDMCKELEDISKHTKEDIHLDTEKDMVKKNSEKNEDIEKLNILLKVKDLDAREKQKKYEANTSTLLRKVKEQISEKKIVKKIYTDELNNLRLLYETMKTEKESMLNVVSELQEELKNVSLCIKCLEYEKQMKFVEKQIEELKSNNTNLKQLCDDGKIIIEKFQKDNQELVSINSALSTDNDDWKNKFGILLAEKSNWSEELSSLQQKSDDDAALVETLKELLEMETLHLSEMRVERSQLDMKLADVINKYELISNENQVLTTSLKSKNEELISHERCKSMEGWKTQLEMQSELQSINSEKFFLQRLNNDLKFALREQVNYNKILKDGICKQQASTSLPNFPTNVHKYDENYIKGLMKKNKASFGERAKFYEVHSCLNSMKRHILAIQEDIVKKNEY